jgi:hypothetical protein
MAAAPYFDLVREMRDAYNHRLRLMQHARQRGIKPTARAFVTTVPTVRKWLRRFQQHGPSGLPQFLPQAQSLRLPLVEYTAREVRSGLLFWAFAQKRSAAASAVFAARIQQHLDRWGFIGFATETGHSAQYS